MLRAIFAAAVAALALVLLAPAPSQFFSVSTPQGASTAPVLTRSQPLATLPPGALLVRPQRLAPPATSSVGYGLVAGGLGLSAVAMLATSAEDRKALQAAKEQERKLAAAAKLEARAAKEKARQAAAPAPREARPAGAERKAAGRKRGEVAAPAPVKLTREQELAAAQEELRLAKLELEQARAKKVAQEKKASAKPLADLKLPDNPFADLKLPAISLPTGGSQSTVPADFPIKDPNQGLIAGAAIGALPAAALISLRAFLVSGRSRR